MKFRLYKAMICAVVFFGATTALYGTKAVWPHDTYKSVAAGYSE